MFFFCTVLCNHLLGVVSMAILFMKPTFTVLFHSYVCLAGLGFITYHGVCLTRLCCCLVWFVCLVYYVLSIAIIV